MIQLIRGFRDILPGETELWQRIEATAVELLQAFGFREIRLPILERTELFARSIGETTDIVEKEMYTFPDRKGDLITMRPEATAAVCRAYIQHRLHAVEPVQKLYTIGPMFRRERPQKGRYRQFYQINAEIIGDGSPHADAQLILILVRLLERLAVRDATAHINSLGCPDCRPAFREALLAYIDRVAERLCADCLRRRHTNPLRVLDCKVPGCREAMAGAPSLGDFLCPVCRAHFDALRRNLDRLAVAYTLDPRLVRGLDYYSRTTFEIQTGALGAQSAIAGGGRYDGLMATLDGPPTPATGFAIGLDRLAEIAARQQAPGIRRPQLYVAALGEAAQALAFEWIAAWGSAGIFVETDFTGRSLKSQMKRADRLGAARVLILGADEIQRGTAQLRDMATGEQRETSLEGIVERLRATPAAV